MGDQQLQKDLVLSINEYAYILDKTKGYVTCWVGPAKTSLSTSDELVRFDERSKQFISCNYENAIRLFVTAPENWYIVLKNPASNGKHPTAGTSNTSPEGMDIGRKVNIKGPTSFALYPGQMAKAIKGHSLRSNQYLLARVYEANSANESKAVAFDADGKEIENKSNYVNGQILVIKGTDVSFYIPPDGIEVISVDNKGVSYVRDAVTLERLEYCILKDENGNKRYLHGPEVVFPEPTETFVTAPKPNGGYIFRAIELSKISGIYVKVIAEYTDENEVTHPVGEEMFITGDQQMIYYPRPEHAIINYDNKIMHHAIAIPNGEGRYVMDRLTGVIKTVRGPAMYLPDPRTEVVVKRKLTANQCEMWYPGNTEAYAYNVGLSEQAVEKSLKHTNLDEFTSFCSTSRESSSLAMLEAKANISRGTSYTKPRTIMLDNKYDGVVSIDIWTGYAVNIISKDGTRKVVKGPQTILMDYDQTLEVLSFSTGKPKTTDSLERSVFLRHKNGKVSDIISAQTRDYVDVDIKLSYHVNFNDEDAEKWFSVENYVKYLCDRLRSLIKSEIKKYDIEKICCDYTSILKDIVLDADNFTSDTAGFYFPENGMCVYDVDIMYVRPDGCIRDIMEEHQLEMVRQSIELSDADKRLMVAEKMADVERRKLELKTEAAVLALDFKREENMRRAEIDAEIARLKEVEAAAEAQASSDMQEIYNAIQAAELSRSDAEHQLRLKKLRNEAEIEKQKTEAYTKAVSEMMQSISPDLIATLSTRSNNDMLTAVVQGIAPYAMAKGKSVDDFVQTLLNGTPIEKIISSANIDVK